MDIPKNIDKSVPQYPEFDHDIALYHNNYIIRKFSCWPDHLPLPVSLAPHSFSYGPPVVDWWCSPLSNLWVYGDHEYYYFIRHGLIGYSQIWRCGHPMLYLKDLKISNNKLGTIALPRTAVEGVPWEKFDKYLESLTKLPKEMHPITVSLPHSASDYQDECQQFGIDAICFGHHGQLYYKNLTEGLSKFKYATSNYFGTPSLISTYVGCRFLYYNKELPEVFNSSGKKINPPIPYENLFSLDNRNKQLDEKKKITDYHLGALYKKTPLELNNLLIYWATDFKYQLLSLLQKKYFPDDLRPLSNLIRDDRPWPPTSAMKSINLLGDIIKDDDWLKIMNDKIDSALKEEP